MIVVFHRDFKKQHKRLSEKLRAQFFERLLLLRQNPLHPLLHNHQLSGAYQGSWCINVTGDLRAVYDYVENDVIQFTHIGTHHQLFGS